MDWQTYEQEIEEQFRTNYPAAQITRNAKLVGRFSKVERQIDILIEERGSDFAFRIVVDAKYRGRKLDVSDVEAFIGLTRDVEAHTGMMVALEGYTPAAVNRAHKDDLDIILDVLNFEELKSFQGPTAIPYSGENGVWVAAPLGWVVDATRRQHFLASLYQRGLTFEDAVRSDEWMYINFWSKNDPDASSLDALLKFQGTYMLGGSPGSKIEIVEEGRNHRVGARTVIRRFRKETYPALEYTGFVDFERFVVMCVLFTPENLERKNLRKLRFIIRDCFPMSVKHDHSGKIKEAESRLAASPSTEERAGLLAKIGFWRREMGDLEGSKRALEESLAVVANNHYALTQLRQTLTRIGDKGAMVEAMGRLLRLDPHNPTVFDECIAYKRPGIVGPSDLLTLFEHIASEFAHDQLVAANCNFYAGRILIDVDPASARTHMLRARELFRNIFPTGHPVFSTLRSGLRHLSNLKKERSHPSR